jgi:hypothetical protein
LTSRNHGRSLLRKNGLSHNWLQRIVEKLFLKSVQMPAVSRSKDDLIHRRRIKIPYQSHLAILNQGFKFTDTLNKECRTINEGVML